MNPEVRSRWIAWSAQFEGRVAWMYLDQHKDKNGNLDPLVTTGVGNLIDASPQADPWRPALPLPWRLSGSPATPDMIRAEWQKVKADKSLATKGWQAAGRVTALRLSESAIDDLVLARLEANDAIFARRIPTWSTWPYKAQMVRHSIGWACGPNEPYPKFEAAVAARAWAVAIEECYIPDKNNPGVVPRNAADRALLRELQAGIGATPTAANSAVVGTPGGAPTPAPRAGLLAAILRALGWRG